MGETSQVKVSGNGRIIGVVLHKLGSGPQPELNVMVSNSCFVRACRPDGVVERPFQVGYGLPRSTAGPGGGYTVTLPAGRYNAVLLADGAPVTASVKLSGLAASRTLRPSTPATAEYQKIRGQTPEQPGHVYSTGGRSYTIRGPSLVMNSVGYSTAFGGQMEVGTCWIDGEAPPNHLYGPHCPNLDIGDDTYNVQFGYGTAPEYQTESARVFGFGMIGFTPTAGPVPLTVGNYVISATPLVSSDRLHLVVRVPQRASS